MAEDTGTTSSSSEGAKAKPKADEPKERRYTVDELAARSRTLFDPPVSPHAVRGAFAGYGHPTATAKTAQAKVAAFTSRRVGEGA